MFKVSFSECSKKNRYLNKRLILYNTDDSVKYPKLATVLWLDRKQH
jgi:hypothetical protein